MRSFVYPAKLSPEKRGFTVQFPDLPEAITSGKNRADALLQAADCLEEAVAGRIADGLDLPAPSRTGKTTSPSGAACADGSEGGFVSGDSGSWVNE